MKKIAIIFTVILLSANRFAEVQEIKITGTVTNGADGTGIHGVNIVEKTTKNSTRSDKNGKYTLNVKSESSILVYSLIGFQTIEVNINSKRIIDVKLLPDIKAEITEVLHDEEVELDMVLSEPLRGRMLTMGEWWWGTRPVDPFEMYFGSQQYLEEVFTESPEDYAAVAHAVQLQETAVALGQSGKLPVAS